jgi:ribosome-interacting GTPase 1
LDSLSRNENRFNYVKLYQNSEFKEIMSILDKLYDPEIKLTESEKDTMRALNARDGITVFVRDKNTNDIYLYDVLRIIRDYAIVNYYFSSDLNTVEMDDLARQKIEYFSEFSNPLIVEIENLDYPRERKIYPTFDGTIFYVSGGKRAIDSSFKNLKEKGLFKRIVQSRVLREEGCVQVRDTSDSRMSWIWGFSSKLV